MRWLRKIKKTKQHGFTIATELSRDVIGCQKSPVTQLSCVKKRTSTKFIEETRRHLPVQETGSRNVLVSFYKHNCCDRLANTESNLLQRQILHFEMSPNNEKLRLK